MGTRSVIGVMHGDVCKSVYCHWDGYLDHNGRILQENYDSTKANFLVALGDISSLGEEIGEKHPFDSYTLSPEEKAKYQRWTTFYGRDREEENVSWQATHSFEEFMKRVNNCGAEYYYIMKDGVWYCGDNYGSSEISGKLIPLREALEMADAEEQE